MKNIILIAPPAAGKGTQADMLCYKYNLVHISIGDLLREEIKKGSEIGHYLESQMKSGKLVKDKIIIDLLHNRLNENDCKKGFILDGFPRNLNQAEQLDKMNIKIDYVFYLDVEKEVLINRITGRVVCSSCGTVYNNLIETLKSKQENICDKCNSELIKRIDDNIETFENRYETYINETQPIIDFYRNKGILYDIKQLEKQEVFEEIVKILGDI